MNTHSNVSHIVSNSVGIPQTDKTPTDSPLGNHDKKPPTYDTTTHANNDSLLRKFEELKKYFISTYSDVINDDIRGRKMTVGKPMEIVLRKDIPITPFHVSIAKPIPLHYRQMAEAQVQKMLDDKIIARVDEPTEWLAPAFFVPKSCGTKLRFVCDFSKLNGFLLRNFHPFASAWTCLQQIPSGTRYFASADALHGYFQVPLSSKSSRLCNFLLFNGKFKFLVAPQGLSTSSDEFLRRSDYAIQNCPGVIKLVDDLLVYSDSLQGLRTNLITLLEKLRKHNISLSEKKFHIATEVKFAGVLISQHGIRPDPKRLDALLGLSRPRNLKETRGWLGAVAQLGYFHPGLSALLKDTQNLTKKGVAWQWLDVHDKCFAEVKEMLRQDLQLKFYDHIKPAILMVDASFEGIGACLLQVDKTDEQGRVTKYNLISCASRAVTETEGRYSTTELECLGLVWGFRKFDYYLRGAQDTQVITDHRPLVGVFQKPMNQITNPRLLRLREKLQMYKFELKWNSGKSIPLPDYLSRRPVSTPDLADAVLCNSLRLRSGDEMDPDCPSMKQMRADANACPTYSLMKRMLLKRERPEDKKNLPKEILHYQQIWDDLSIDSDFIVYDNRILLPLPSRDRILKIIHSPHQGPDRSVAFARCYYFWHRMTEDIKLVCDSCEKCLAHKPSQPKQPWITTECTQPFEQLSMDVFHLEGKKFLIMMDRFSGYPWVVPISTESTAVVINKLEDLFFTCCFTPMALRHDGARCFTSTDFAEYLDMKDIIDERSSAHYHQSNGMVENRISQVKTLLKKYNGIFGQAFKDALNVFRTTPTLHIKTKKSIGSPVQRLFSMTHRLPGLPSLPVVHEPVDWKKLSDEKRSAAHARRDYYNQTCRELKPLEKGQFVAIQDPITKLWDRFGYIMDRRTSSGRSYLVKTHDHLQHTLERNRRFLRPADLIEISKSSQ